MNPWYYVAIQRAEAWLQTEADEATRRALTRHLERCRAEVADQEMAAGVDIALWWQEMEETT